MISWSLIHKDSLGIPALFQSLRPFLAEGDEVVVLDTGSAPERLAELEQILATLPCPARAISRPDLVRPDMRERMRAIDPQVFEQFGNHPQFRNGCIDDFAAARNIAREHCTRPILAWLDCDDVMAGDPKEFRADVESFFGQGLECAMLRYDYATDPTDGTVTTTLWRERLVPREKYVWRGACHEVLVPINGHVDPSKIAQLVSAWVVHGEHRKKHEFSDLRNAAILTRQVEEGRRRGHIDPRTLYYLGNAHRGLKHYNEAIRAYLEFLPISGSPDDRVLTTLHLGQLYAALGRYGRALQAYRAGHEIAPHDPRPHFGMQLIYFFRHQFERSIYECRLGLGKVENFRSINAVNPVELVTLPHYNAAMAFQELGRPAEAAAEAQAAIASRPNHVPTRQGAEAILEWARAAQVASAIHTVVGLVKDRALAPYLLQNIHLPPNPSRFGLGPPEASARPVAIWCGPTAEEWGPDSRETGVGGSERMVIDLARALAARKVSLTVYANLPADQRGERDGVLWRHYSEYNPELDRDVLIAWRSPGAALIGKARRRHVWMHDIGGNGLWTPDVLAAIDKAIFLSPWHRRQNSAVPDAQAYVSRNGIDSNFISSISAPRNQRQFVYASSPDRGLYTLLKRIWPSLVRRHPNLQLKIAYGFTPTYYAMGRTNPHTIVEGYSRNRFEYAEEIELLVDSLPGVQVHGRLGAGDFLGLLRSSGALLYPAHFDETFCIVAAEAQACGVWPIVFDRAALSTTVRWGERVPDGDLNEFVAAVERYLDTPPSDGERRRQAAEAQRHFDIESLADDWVRDLL